MLRETGRGTRAVATLLPLPTFLPHQKVRVEAPAPRAYVPHPKTRVGISRDEAQRISLAEQTPRPDAVQEFRRAAEHALEWAVLKRWERAHELAAFQFESRHRTHACWNNRETIVTLCDVLQMTACSVCRRVHQCRRTWDECIKMLTPDGAYVCAFSGQAVECEEAVGTFEGECRAIAQRYEQGLNFGGGGIEGILANDQALPANARALREWDRQDTRQKRWRDEDAPENDSPRASGPPAKRTRLADTAPEPPAATDAMDVDADVDVERVLPVDEHALGTDGGGDDDGGGGGSGGGGDDKETRITSADARTSGLSVGAWQRSTNRLMKIEHNIAPLDASKVPASFLQSVPLNLNACAGMEQALRAFDAVYADELTLESQFGSGRDPETDTRGDDKNSLTETSNEDDGPPSAAGPLDATQPVTTKRAFKRALQRAKGQVEQDIRSLVRVLADDQQETPASLRTRADELVAFAMRLFRVLLLTSAPGQPMRLARLGMVLVLELLPETFFVLDTVGRRSHQFLIWNADAWLAQHRARNALDMLFIEDARRNKNSVLRNAARHQAPHQIQKMCAFRDARNVTRATFTEWAATLRSMVRKTAEASPQAFHAALFSCPLQ